MRAMVFIDYQNFNINQISYYQKNAHLSKPKIIYQKLSKEIVNSIKIEDSVLLKTFLFAYRPCDTLMNLPQYRTYYSWLTGIKNTSYLEVIEGIQEVRPTNHKTPIDVNNQTTFYTEEKGTDINLAVNMVSKAFTNAYDIAVLVSGDTDYLPVIKQLHNLGKIVVLATFPEQNIKKYKNFYDEHVVIDDTLLQKCTN